MNLPEAFLSVSQLPGRRVASLHGTTSRFSSSDEDTQDVPLIAWLEKRPAALRCVGRITARQNIRCFFFFFFSLEALQAIQGLG